MGDEFSRLTKEVATIINVYYYKGEHYMIQMKNENETVTRVYFCHVCKRPCTLHSVIIPDEFELFPKKCPNNINNAKWVLTQTIINENKV
jgi:hypothetical protein